MSPFVTPLMFFGDWVAQFVTPLMFFGDWVAQCRDGG
jgi:hypothetical protein